MSYEENHDYHITIYSLREEIAALKAEVERLNDENDRLLKAGHFRYEVKDEGR